MMKESETVDETQEEVFSENISEQNSETGSILIQEEELIDTEENEVTVTLQESAVQSDNEDEDKSETQEYESETEETEEVNVAANYERISRVSRDDGIWLYPLNKNHWNKFSDWAGCPGESKCSFCGKVHQGWGDKAHTGQKYGHNGFDIGVSIGTDVLAAASGTVAYTSIGNNGGRGNFIVIEHAISGTNYSYYSYYQHLNVISVSKGRSVKAGDVIAKSGNSGIGTGAHLHFGIVLAQKGTDIGKRLYSIESNGWVTGSEYKEGRILVNPSIKQQNMPTGSANVIPPLAYHSGSITYTFDKNKVTIGSNSASGESQLAISGQASPGSLKVGSSWTCTGTITSNYTLTHVGGYILGSDDSTIIYEKL